MATINITIEDIRRFCRIMLNEAEDFNSSHPHDVEVESFCNGKTITIHRILDFINDDGHEYYDHGDPSEPNYTEPVHYNYENYLDDYDNYDNYDNYETGEIRYNKEYGYTYYVTAKDIEEERAEEDALYGYYEYLASRKGEARRNKKRIA